MPQPMTVQQWLQAQIAQLDNLAYIAGYQAGYRDGMRRAFEMTVEAIGAGPPASPAVTDAPAELPHADGFGPSSAEGND